MKIKSEKEINIVRGKLLVNKATQEEINDFLNYVEKIEELVKEASQEDFYGSEGYEHILGWD